MKWKNIKVNIIPESNIVEGTCRQIVTVLYSSSVPFHMLMWPPFVFLDDLCLSFETKLREHLTWKVEYIPTIATGVDYPFLYDTSNFYLS